MRVTGQGSASLAPLSLALLMALCCGVAWGLAEAATAPWGANWRAKGAVVALPGGSVKAAADSYEPDDTPAQATTIATDGTPQTHTISPASDVDYVKFEAAVGTTYVIETSAAGSDDVEDTVVHLYDTDGTTQLAEDDDGGIGYYSKLVYSFGAAGTYYLGVHSYDSRYVGSYNVAITTVETVHGQVTDGLNPLENVGIWVVDANKAYDEPVGVAATDASGSYACLVPDGTYRVTAHLHGYVCSPLSREVTVPGDTTANFTMTAVPAPPGDGVTTCRAVLVGISDYVGTWNDLSYCDADATGFADALVAGSNWQDANIQLLLNRQATAANIWAALQRMATQADGDDLCLFLFSGHGTSGPDVAPLDEDGGYDEYLCETDLANNIRDDELGEWIATLPTEKVMVVLCSCYSGGFIKGTLATKGLGQGDPPGTRRGGFADELRRAMAAKAARRLKDLDDNGYGVVITAADDDETCAESHLLEHDVLVYYLLEGMAGPGDADGDGWLTAEEIYGYAAPRATTFNSGQHAQLYDADAVKPFAYLHLEDVAGPVLSWLGVGPYAADGVDPDRGGHNAWYTFKVNYAGAAPSYVRLHLFRHGTEVVGSPYDMHPGMGNPGTGRTFWFKRRLCKGTYGYRFTASDGTHNATGEPTQEQTGPIVANRPPRLEWAGYGEWETDPVDPQGRKLPGTDFTWKIKYLDREGDAPEYVRVHIARRTLKSAKPDFEDQEIEGSPFDMTAGGTDYANGAVYAYSRALTTEGRYVCWFSAREEAPEGYDSQDACGVPTWWRRSLVWIFNIPPKLMWAPGPEFRGDGPPDGLHPNQGGAGDTFTFKVQYRDPEGAEPDYVRLHLLKWDGSQYVEVGASPYEMSTEAVEFEVAEYSIQVQPGAAGRYRYYFAASDGDKDAVGEPTWHRMRGPIVDGAGASSAQVGALSCCPAGTGAQVTFTLSAEGAVTAEVLNIAGRPVKLLVSDRAMSAGSNTLIWDGRSAKGLAVPSGIYLVRVKAADQDGGQSEALAMVRIAR